MKVSHPRLRAAIGGILLLASVAPVTAQQAKPAPDVPILRDIPLAEWLDRTLGRTVYYSIEGATFGREYYAPDGRSVVFQHVDGTCMEGEWSYQPDISAYCFVWPGALSCFRHVDRGDDTLIIAVEPDGSPKPQTFQDVDRIATVPLSCGPAVTS